MPFCVVWYWAGSRHFPWIPIWSTTFGGAARIATLGIDIMLGSGRNAQVAGLGCLPCDQLFSPGALISVWWGPGYGDSDTMCRSLVACETIWPPVVGNSTAGLLSVSSFLGSNTDGRKTCFSHRLQTLAWGPATFWVHIWAVTWAASLLSRAGLPATRSNGRCALWPAYGYGAYVWG